MLHHYYLYVFSLLVHSMIHKKGKKLWLFPPSFQFDFWVILEVFIFFQIGNRRKKSGKGGRSHPLTPPPPPPPPLITLPLEQGQNLVTGEELVSTLDNILWPMHVFAFRTTMAGSIWSRCRSWYGLCQLPAWLSKSISASRTEDKGLLETGQILPEFACCCQDLR